MLAKAEVGKLDMAILIEQDVIRFQVSMDVVNLVDSFDRKNRLSDVKAALVFCENIFSNQKGHEISAWQEVHDEIEVLFVLEGVLKVDNPRVLGLHENFALGFDVGHLVLVDHLGLFHLFHGNYLTSLLVAADAHLAEGATADNGERVEVTDGDLLAPAESEKSLLTCAG
jgi:hypothetical protein